jgi:TonB family protein
VASPEHFVWAVDGKPVSIHLGADVVRALEPWLRSGSPGRENEIGGFLLGRSRQVNDSWIVAAEGIELAACEHARGPSWTLSRADREAFARQMRRLSDRRVVGWFRTHTRPGLYLDQHDFDLFRDFFHHPAAIALVARPDSTAGFFFWENGDVERTRPCATFSLRTEAMKFTPQPVRNITEPQPGIARSGVRKELLWIPALAGIGLAMFWSPTLPFGNRTEPAGEPAAVAAGGARPVFQPPERKTPEPGLQPAVLPVQTPPAARTTEPTAPLPVRASAGLEVPPPRPSSAGEKKQPVPAAVVATAEPPKPHLLKRAVGSIPGLSFLKKPKTEDLDAPPVVARRVRPARFDDTSPVRVKVKIGKDGYVKSAHLLTTSTNAATASSVIRAARSWRFTPARQANRPVESEMVLTFQPDSGGGNAL